MGGQRHRKNEIVLSGFSKPAQIIVFETLGHTLTNMKSNTTTVSIPYKSKGIRIVKIISVGNTQVSKLMVE